MKRQILIIAALLFTELFLQGAETKYPVSEIPDSLKQNSKAVIRNWELTFELKSIGKGIETVSYAVTILNENGLDEAVFSRTYSQKLNRIHSIKGTIYDASGKKVENLITDKVVDHSMISGYSLYEDTRIKYFKPRTLSYPFTVEYSYVMEHDGLLEISDWKPVHNYNISVESSKFRVVCPNDITFRYLEKNIADKPKITKTDLSTTTEWSVQNIKAYDKQPFSGPLSEFSPIVYTAPNEFEMEGFRGSMESWDSFGKWIILLNSGRSTISPETSAILRDRVKDCNTDYEKARLVYKYMQDKTRYMNITIGIGGWQPIHAETVDRLGYGDCKALSNYTRSLLDAVGVKSYYALVTAGEDLEEMTESFPGNRFNHAILYVPMANDTVWLECTNQHLPFGYIGGFTDDRKALIITDDGAKIVRTTVYTAANNKKERTTQISLDPLGDAVLSIKAIYNGVHYDDKMMFYMAGTDDRKRMFLDEINLPGAILNTINYEDIRSEIPAIREEIEMDLPRYGTLTGARMLVSVVPLGRQRDIPRKVNERKSEVIIKRSTVTTDTVLIRVPEGYEVEAVPARIHLESEFGSYSLSVSVPQPGMVLCVRNIGLNKGKLPPANYNNLIEFYRKITAADNSKVSLKKI